MARIVLRSFSDGGLLLVLGAGAPGARMARRTPFSATADASSRLLDVTIVGAAQQPDGRLDII
jgi:hypothetical protein